MNERDTTFFDAYETFLTDHTHCQDGPEHTRLLVWLPTDSDECSVALTCICGTRVVLPSTRMAGQSIVMASRVNGIPVAESRVEDGVH